MKPFRIFLALLCASLAGLPARADVPASMPARTEDFQAATSRVIAEIGRQLAAHFNAEGELSLELLRAWVSPTAEAELARVEIMEYPSVLASSMLVRVRLHAIGRPSGEHSLLVRAQLFRDAWAARGPIERAIPLDPAQLDVRRVDLLRDRDALPTSVNTADLVIARTIGAGRLLTWRDVTRRALVRKGEVIEISATDGMLSITMKGLAMENGAAGEMVRVRNLDSKKEFSALVVADARAQVRF